MDPLRYGATVMLSYRHAFHAGNHADVLKHWVLVLCLQYLKQKPKPIFYIDTHAGAGRYVLNAGYAAQTEEAKQGIGRFWSADNGPLTGKSIPAVLADYLALIHAHNPKTLGVYPGSPAIAAQVLRAEDRLRLMEMHSADRQLLQQLLGADPRVNILDGDGFAQLRALLPPPSRRGLILIDPSYEVKEDYQHVVDGVGEALKRFATGTYLIWYPLLNTADSAKLRKNTVQRLLQDLQSLAEHWLNVQLQVSAPPKGHGMYGSGLFVINPPWVLQEQLQAGLPALVERLGQDNEATFRLETGGVN